MRVVLDTNVFVSGIFFGGFPYRILIAWRDGRIQLALSPKILDDYQRVGEILSEDYPNINVKPFIDYVISNAEVYAESPLTKVVCEDPDDDKFIACALASNCMVIVSGDKHLLKVSGYKEIKVLKPREFVEKYLS